MESLILRLFAIPFTKVVINLKEVDRKFIEKYSTYKHSDMLDELKQVGDGVLHISQVSFIHHIVDLFRKGMCRNDNDWIVTEIPCE